MTVNELFDRAVKEMTLQQVEERLQQHKRNTTMHDIGDCEKCQSLIRLANLKRRELK